jgi:hypothetical protein
MLCPEQTDILLPVTFGTLPIVVIKKIFYFCLKGIDYPDALAVSSQKAF